MASGGGEGGTQPSSAPVQHAPAWAKIVCIPQGGTSGSPGSEEWKKQLDDRTTKGIGRPRKKLVRPDNSQRTDAIGAASGALPPAAQGVPLAPMPGGALAPAHLQQQLLLQQQQQALLQQQLVQQQQALQQQQLMLQMQSGQSGNQANPMMMQPGQSGNQANPMMMQPGQSGNQANPMMMQPGQSGNQANPMMMQPGQSGNQANPMMMPMQGGAPLPMQQPPLQHSNAPTLQQQQLLLQQLSAAAPPPPVPPPVQGQVPPQASRRVVAATLVAPPGGVVEMATAGPPSILGHDAHPQLGHDPMATLKLEGADTACPPPHAYIPSAGANPQPAPMLPPPPPRPTSVTPPMVPPPTAAASSFAPPPSWQLFCTSSKADTA